MNKFIKAFINTNFLKINEILEELYKLFEQSKPEAVPNTKADYLLSFSNYINSLNNIILNTYDITFNNTEQIWIAWSAYNIDYEITLTLTEDLNFEISKIFLQKKVFENVFLNYSIGNNYFVSAATLNDNYETQLDFYVYSGSENINFRSLLHNQELCYLEKNRKSLELTKLTYFFNSIKQLAKLDTHRVLQYLFLNESYSKEELEDIMILTDINFSIILNNDFRFDLTTIKF